MKLICFLLLISFAVSAQEDKKVMEPIHQLFAGMQKGDSAMVHKAFTASPNTFTVMVDPKTNQPWLRPGALADFLKAIGTPHKEVWNEMIWSPKIEVDGNLAQVWVPYGFYRDKTFSHCGVDAFQLFKDTSGEWKIFQLTDTRQKTGCNIPKEVTDQLK